MRSILCWKASSPVCHHCAFAYWAKCAEQRGSDSSLRLDRDGLLNQKDGEGPLVPLHSCCQQEDSLGSLCNLEALTQQGNSTCPHYDGFTHKCCGSVSNGRACFVILQACHLTCSPSPLRLSLEIYTVDGLCVWVYVCVFSCVVCGGVTGMEIDCFFLHIFYCISCCCLFSFQMQTIWCPASNCAKWTFHYCGKTFESLLTLLLCLKNKSVLKYSLLGSSLCRKSWTGLCYGKTLLISCDVQENLCL